MLSLFLFTRSITRLNLLVSLFLASFCSSAIAQSLSTPSVRVFPLSDIKTALEFPEANVDRGKPQQTAGAGVRGNERTHFINVNKSTCFRGNGRDPLNDPIMLLPISKNNDKKELINVREDIDYPVANRVFNIYLYLPVHGFRQLDLSIFDPILGKNVTTYQLPLIQKQGFYKVPVQLPDDVTANKGIKVTLSFTCDPTNNIDEQNQTVAEFTILYDPIDVKPVELNSGQTQDTRHNSSTNSQQLLSQAQVYADQHYWIEALAIMMEIQSDFPDEWRELLDSGGFQAWREQEIVECCAFE